jgi:hypothetical protein
MATGNIAIANYIGTFLNEYNRADAAPWFTEVANINTGVSKLGVYPGINPTGGLTKLTNGRKLAAPGDFKLELTNEAYEDSISVATGDYNSNPQAFEQLVKEMGRKARAHWRKLILALIAANGDSVDVDDDGAEKFFSATHNYNDGAGKTFSNLIDKDDLAVLDVTDKAKPTDVEMSDILLGAATYMISTMVDAAGDPCNDDMKRIVVVTGDAPKHAAVLRAISANWLSSGASNPVNALLEDGFTFRPVIEPALTGDDIFLFRGDSLVKPFVCQEDQIEIQALGPGSEYAQANLKVLFGVSSNRAAGYGRYMSALKATLSTKAAG